MKRLLAGIIIIVGVLVIVAGYNSNYFSYYNCMSQTKLDSTLKKAAKHVAAICKTFILEKVMFN